MKTPDAKRFFNELMNRFECISDIATYYGKCTLADVVYFQGVLLEKPSYGCIDYFPHGESMILDVLCMLPSRSKWLKRVHIRGERE